MRLFAPTTRNNRFSRVGLLFAGLLALTQIGWSQATLDLETIRTRANSGDLEAQNALGNAYTNGVPGQNPDFAEALKWYQQAGDKGYAPAQFNLGLVYELGRGQPVDEQRAFHYYLKSAEQGYAPAQFNVGNMYASGRGVGQDYFEANLWYKQAADNGLVEAQYNLGLAYESGRGVKKDETQAARWYKQAADRGYPRAQYNLGLLLEDGRGVTKDVTAATALYRAAAEQGLAPAQINFGLALADGRPGLARDPVQAFVWLNRAVQNGASPEARDALAKTLTSEQLSAANQLLGGARAAGPAPGQATATASDNTSARLIEQLREQSRRLSGQVQSLNAEKEAMERQSAIQAAQIRDLHQDLQQARGTTPAASAAPAGEASRHQGEIAALNSKLTQAVAALKKAEESQAQLTEVNQRLQQEKASPAAADLGKGTGPDAAQQSSIMASLQRDNARLNDEVKRSTRELLSLNQQLRGLRSAPAQPVGEAEANSEQITQLTTKARQSAEQAARWEADNQRLTARIAELEKAPRPAVADSGGAQLAEARQASERLQQQVTTLQGEKAELEKWSASLEKSLNEKSAATAVQESGADVLRQKLAKTGEQLQERDQPLARQTEAVTGLVGENKDLKVRLARAEDQLKSASPAKVDTGDADKLRQQLLAANQALEKSTASVAELTAANQELEGKLAAAGRGTADAEALRKEVAAARRDRADLAALRDDNIRLREEAAQAAGARAKIEQAGQDSAQLTASLNRSRQDLEQSQARVNELEKQLADALTVRTRGGDAGQKSVADLAEANRTVEKLTATVAELTAANEKLEKDLDNAQKSTAAALVAQSQAVSAASPDAFQSEISTLNARVKQLEAQVEEERANTAKEVSTLAAQMQRLHETNKSLTDANRALLSAKDSDAAATRDDFEQLQGKVRDLTTANEELRRTGQKQAADLRGLGAERDGLQSQLADARKVATVLPALTDEKAALQERLEAVGRLLVKLQHDNEGLQTTHDDLVRQLAESRQATEKAHSELAALEGRAAEAEKAAETHTTSVAELTQANAKLEQQQEDMRRLVESYRADITRLTQTVRAAEQQKVDAERSGQQNIDAVTAQLGQVRREVEAARSAQARLSDNFAAQDRDRAAVISQLRTENGSLAARLNQAQSTLDQIAAAARLGTPASVIASGGPAPVRPAAPVAAPAPETRYHTVAEGDSLSRISLRYYGTANRWQEIFQANRDVLQGSSALRVGMQLRIP